MRTFVNNSRGALVRLALLLGAGGAGVYFSTRAALLEQFDETCAPRPTPSAPAPNNTANASISKSPKIPYVSMTKMFRWNFSNCARADGATVRRSKSLVAADLPVRFGTVRRPKFWNLTLPSIIEAAPSATHFTPLRPGRGRCDNRTCRTFHCPRLRPQRVG